jgi:methyltransferase (TIGR00027 family)
MKAGRSSRTAEYNALFRALERRPFADPLAVWFLTPPLAAVARVATIPGARKLVQRYIDRRWPGVRTSVVARTQLIDDAVTEAVAQLLNVVRCQFVILGAGFDSRPHRLESLRDLSVYEVDHPNTQAAKRSRLASSGAPTRSDVRYVAADFTSDRFADLLADAAYDSSAPTIIVWEGVSNYLTAEAVDSTLQWCAATAPGSVLIFTYVNRDVLTNPAKYVGTGNLARSLARSGEPLTFGIDPNDLHGYLADRGLDLVSDSGATEYRTRYYGNDACEIRGHEFYRVAVARVATRGHR